MNETNTVDVRHVIDKAPFSPFQLLILILGVLVLMLDGYDVAAIGFVAPKLLAQWNITRPELAPVLSAALVGLAIGAVVAGPFADRIGRKRIIVLAAGFFGVFTVAAAFSSSIEMLTWMRFATGLGLGAAFPNTVTLVAEYCPQRSRSFLVSILLTGFVLGTALGGLVAAEVIEVYGWPAVMLIGGILPLVLTVVLSLSLPESLRFLVVRGDADAHIAGIVKRIDPKIPESAHFINSEVQKVAQHTPIRVMLSAPLAVGSYLLWLTYFAGLVVIYFILSWLPTLITQQGFELTAAAKLVSFFTLAGPVGAWLAGWVMDRLSPHAVIGVCYLVAAIFLWQVGTHAGDMTGLYWSVGLAGFFINASQSTISALAANFYPTQGRATGVSWMMGVGRLGGILGAAMGGTLLSKEMSFAQIFVIMAISSVVAGLAVLAKGMYYSRS